MVKIQRNNILRHRRIWWE